MKVIAGGAIVFGLVMSLAVAGATMMDEPSANAGDKEFRTFLRVTTIFRKESGAWKLIHRHEDPLITKTPPAAVIQKAVPPK